MKKSVWIVLLCAAAPLAEADTRTRCWNDGAGSLHCETENVPGPWRPPETTGPSPYDWGDAIADGFERGVRESQERRIRDLQIQILEQQALAPHREKQERMAAQHDAFVRRKAACEQAYNAALPAAVTLEEQTRVHQTYATCLKDAMP